MASWTGFSPTMGANGANVNSTSGSQIDGRTPLRGGIGRMFRARQLRSTRALFADLIGAATGDTVTANFSQVTAKQALLDPMDLGGLVAIADTYRLGSSTAGRATTAADVTTLKALIAQLSALAPASYPADASGNGGGGKIGR